MSGGIPSGAVGASVAVLLYSAGCLTLSSSLTCLLIIFGEAWSYVAILSGATALSTFASICQQLHYATSWRAIKQAEFDKAILAQTHKGLALGGAAHPVDNVLFLIQFYCYNTMSLNIFFWTIALFTGAWEIRSRWLGDWLDRVPTASKVFSVTWPAVIVGLLQIRVLADFPAAFVTVSYFTMFTSLTVGSVLLALILFKYLKTRRLVAGYSSRRGRWWASDGSKDRTRDVGTGYTMDSAVNSSNSRRSIYDRALVTRFTIGFVLLAIFEVTIILFTIFSASNSAQMAASGSPNFSLSSTISDIVVFLPGVTASLVTFLVFGTTKSWRQYRDLITGGCGLKRRMYGRRMQGVDEAIRPHQGLEFERLPSLQKTPSEEERKTKEDAINRVRMFSKTGGSDTARISTIEIESDDSSSNNHRSGAPKIRPISTNAEIRGQRMRAESEPRVVNFHRPLPVAKSLGTSRQDSTGTIHVGLSFDNDDTSIKRVRLVRDRHERQGSRKFVMKRLPDPQNQTLGTQLESNSSG